MMKKVVIIENSGKCRFGGGQKMSLNIASILSEKFDIIFADFAKKSVYLDKVKEEFPNASILCLKGILSNSNVKVFNWAVETLSVFLCAILNLKKIVSVVGTNNVMTYATDKKTLMYSYMLNVFYGIPFILHAHLVENPRGWYYPLYLMMAKKASTVICCSHSVVDSIKSDNSKLLYNPNFNYHGQKKYHLDKIPFVVAVAGSLIPIKGFEYFVKAAQYVDEGIEFRVYGSGPLEGSLKMKASKNVKFMGFCNDILTELYNSVDVVAVVTIIKEANSLAVLEAKSVGLPVVVTNIGGQAELVESGVDGICVPIKDAKSIADAINLLYHDSEKYLMMAGASYKSVSKYDISSYKVKILDLFSKAFRE